MSDNSLSDDVTPYEMLGGAPVIEAIVHRFYRLMDEEEGYSAVRALHADDLTDVRAGLVGFLSAWMGGPKDWFSKGICMMSLHRSLLISKEVARQWAEAMARSIADQPGVDDRLALAMSQRLVMMAQSMVNEDASTAHEDH